MDVQVLKADYYNPAHAHALVSLLDHYALDASGGGRALSQDTKTRLVEALAQLPHALSVLAFHGPTPVGLANCFWGFSTFDCRPLINIHDLVVLNTERGKGVGRRLLTKVEELALEGGASKLTLEVLEHNTRARTVYRQFGFDSYQLQPEFGSALFLAKKLKSSKESHL